MKDDIRCILDALEGKVRIRKVINKGYKEWLEARKKGIKFRGVFSKWQYIYRNYSGHEISLVKISGELIISPLIPNRAPKWYWEAMDLSNENGGIRRFKTRKVAEEWIFDLLGNKG